MSIDKEQKMKNIYRGVGEYYHKEIIDNGSLVISEDKLVLSYIDAGINKNIYVRFIKTESFTETEIEYKDNDVLISISYKGDSFYSSTCPESIFIGKVSANANISIYLHYVLTIYNKSNLFHFSYTLTKE